MFQWPIRWSKVVPPVVFCFGPCLPHPEYLHPPSLATTGFVRNFFSRNWMASHYSSEWKRSMRGHTRTSCDLPHLRTPMQVLNGIDPSNITQLYEIHAPSGPRAKAIPPVNRSKKNLKFIAFTNEVTHVFTGQHIFYAGWSHLFTRDSICSTYWLAKTVESLVL